MSTHGTPGVSYLYRWEGEAFSVSSVNEALGADSVLLDENNRFQAQDSNSRLVQILVYQAGEMKLVNSINAD
ncbi:hypothetical protein ACFO9Q_19335 [Paenibacillus sp. GCM10023252]|uniref:hypothetical protein n=1 Tax=Paenibacillus sp. GCM10023252 TaxID=3252649 RepID=UPI00360A72BC